MSTYQDRFLKAVLQGKHNHPIDKGLSTKNVKKVITTKEIELPNGEIEISKDIEVYKSPLENNSIKCTCGCGGIGVCMNKHKDVSPVSKYIDHKVKLAEGGTEAPRFMGGTADTWIMAGAPLLGAAGGLIFSASLAMKGVYNKFRNSMFGCTKITDPNEKLKCEQQQRMKLISELQSQLNKCNKAKDPKQCQEMLQNKINQEREKVGIGTQ